MSSKINNSVKEGFNRDGRTLVFPRYDCACVQVRFTTKTGAVVTSRLFRRPKVCFCETSNVLVTGELRQYDYKIDLSEEQSVQRLQLVLNNKAPSETTVFRWFREFRDGSNSLQDEEYTERPVLTFTSDNVALIHIMIKDNN
ncbi:hypothetical protein EVAR_6435_1 [Eumeta japonica]|uniref:Mos1 transposase HTH domain-containing protein n=1 Tax=Eumeta variegata TaxID=151549 RepID=A0A4C1TFP1_EUMVA|nr:hypothetical protein EVAR_6435_1 [Eumeta japonica]